MDYYKLLEKYLITKEENLIGLNTIQRTILPKKIETDKKTPEKLKGSGLKRSIILEKLEGPGPVFGLKGLPKN